MGQAEAARKFQLVLLAVGQGREQIWVLGRRHLGRCEGDRKVLGLCGNFVLFLVFIPTLQKGRVKVHQRKNRQSSPSDR